MKLRVIDIKVKEYKYVETKFECKKDFINAEARSAFQNKKAIALMIKRTQGYNHYGVRNAKINNNMVDDRCPRCNQIDLCEYAMQYYESKEL